MFGTGADEVDEDTIRTGRVRLYRNPALYRSCKEMQKQELQARQKGRPHTMEPPLDGMHFGSSLCEVRLI